ncbi:MAG: secondary thiamine-phosphate synthase enzyme YjbQ [Pseudomonadota bacterium]|nr:secondary thiamine-phosphate synthase enzyme YjbQ [Pseudomonadota bacterium]
MYLQHSISIATRGRGTHDITRDVCRFVSGAGVDTGLCHLFVRHTSASLIVCENADPVVREDLERFMASVCPDGDPRFRHTAEGPDDMPAHVRSVLTQTELTLPVADGRCDLGTWQGVYLWEHRTRPHRRTVIMTVHGNGGGH